MSMEIDEMNDGSLITGEHEGISFGHYGVKRRSGRYPWGSGKEPYQHAGDFISRVDMLRKSGFTYIDEDGTKLKGMTAIARSMGISSGELRNNIALAKAEQHEVLATKAHDLRNKGYSLREIAKQMGYKNDSSVRALLKDDPDIRIREARATADFLKKQVDKKGFIDVGGGVELQLNISKEKLNQALLMLKMDGYNVYGGNMPQLTNPGKNTITQVLAAPGKKHSEIYEPGAIKYINDKISRDDGKTFENKFHYPKSMDSKRLAIRYKEDGGEEMDGLVQIRRGVPDLSLGKSIYAQVRILVDDKKYIKGMATYSDDMPPGVDVVFNTNKSKKVSKLDVLKDIDTKNPENPFGSLIKDVEQGGQYWYTDKNGKKQLGLINKRSDEGDWDEWSKKLSPQFLSKQSRELAKSQLDLEIKAKMDEFDRILKVDNPTVKKQLLKSYSDDCDSASVHMKAAALPRQKYHVIMPVPSLRDTECYAPQYNHGEQVALIRFPHGGRFEIPILTVNNRQKDAKKMLGNAIDAIAINKKVADRLSGADFDGDTVLAIPISSKVKVLNMKPLKDLEGFDPKMSYGTIEKDGKYYNAGGNQVKLMTKQYTQKQMGMVSNLITDMTIKGATPAELAKAVRHSMVVIDAYKHKLDYRKSEIDNDIATLRNKYQDGKGTSTLISRAKSQTSVPKTQGEAKINIKGKKYYDPSRPEGALIYKQADDLYYTPTTRDKNTGKLKLKTTDGKTILYDPNNPQEKAKYAPVKVKNNKTGEVTFTNADGSIKYKKETRMQKSNAMSDTDDARTLISSFNTPMERLYADYANAMKNLANKARVEMVNTGSLKTTTEAKQKYSEQLKSLNDKLKKAESNRPLERQAQTMARAVVESIKNENPDLDKSEIKKINQLQLTKARKAVGAERYSIIVDDKEWEAIQNGAVTETQLKKILKYADIDVIRDKATPMEAKQVNNFQINRIKSMANMGYTSAEIAKALGFSTSTVNKYIKKERGMTE